MHQSNHAVQISQMELGNREGRSMFFVMVDCVLWHCQLSSSNHPISHHQPSRSLKPYMAPYKISALYFYTMFHPGLDFL